MKHKVAVLLAVWGAIVGSAGGLHASGLQPRTPTDVYLLIGQSNMAGRGATNAANRISSERVLKFTKDGEWAEGVEPIHFDRKNVGAGPGLAFARAMADADPQAVVGLVPCAVGGTSLARWMPGMDLYTNALARTRAALAKGGRLKGILWHQGEADSWKRENAESYQVRFTEMIDAFRRDLGDEYVPFVAGEVGGFYAASIRKRGGHPFVKEVNLRLRKTSEYVPAMGLVSVEGLKPGGDGIHFTTHSAYELGRRYAVEMKRLQSSPGFGMKRDDWYRADYAWRPDWAWRGFNLQGMRNAKGEPSFREEYFRWMHEWGFNTCRFPIDYRYWVKGRSSDNMFEIDENCRELKALDQAIAWARKYGIHVMLNLHRVPGNYCAPLAAPPAETRVLWDDVEAQRATVKHWEMLARRYRSIPKEALSFNLVNEPAPWSSALYAYVMKQLIAAIRRIDPDRFIVLDGIKGGTMPCMELAGIPGVGFAARGYQPFDFSHQGGIGGGFTAEIGGISWPIDPDTTIVRLSPRKDFPGMSERPLTVLDAPAGTWSLRSSTISGRHSVLAAFADGEKVAERAYEIKENDPGWRKFGYYQGNTNFVRAAPVDQDFIFTLARPAKKLEFRMTVGDWAFFGKLTFTPSSPFYSSNPSNPSNPSSFTLVGVRDFSVRTNRNNTVRFVPGKGFEVANPSPRRNPKWTAGQETVYRWNFAAWESLLKSGAFVIVGEMGVADTVPHADSLAYLRDLRTVIDHMGFNGWLNWGFIGSSFGILDTKRTDVPYEKFHGHRLDRRMLDVLQR